MDADLFERFRANLRKHDPRHRITCILLLCHDISADMGGNLVISANEGNILVCAFGDELAKGVNAVVQEFVDQMDKGGAIDRNFKLDAGGANDPDANDRRIR